ncbi:MAG: OmpA family protein [Nevskiales bacterium]
MKRLTLARLLTGFSVVVCTICPGLSFAAHDDGQIDAPYFGFGGTYVFSDERNRPVETDDGAGAQVFFGWPSSQRWAFELNLSYAEFDAPVSGTDADRIALGLDSVFYVNPDRFTPYFLAGLGAVRNSPDPGREKTDVFGNVGVGLMTGKLNSYGLRLRSDVRYVIDNYHEDPEDLHLNLALVIPTRQTQHVERTERREVEVIPEPVRRPPPPPRDSDGDGVLDRADRCPDTMRGSEVDRYGCAKEKLVVVLRDVNFEFDSARLTPASHPILQAAVNAMRGQPSMRVEIAGHTDHIGSPTYNQRLSLERAASVMNFLVNAGIERSRLTAAGYGETRPVAPNTRSDGRDDPDGRARNRRVEFKILYR